jgi:photosystem II stability/assembly factor-like uncharacterized protein
MRRFLPVVLFSAFFLSGCSLPGSLPFFGSSREAGSVFKSTDAGASFEPKTTINEKQHLTSADILSAAFHPTNPSILYIGTATDGLFRTENGGEEWKPITFPPEKAYGLAVDAQNGDRLFASGSYEGVGKIYLSENAGADFREIYTEPGPGTVITALAVHPMETQVVYAGTSAGSVIKSTDGGMTWKNVTTATAPVTQILFDRSNPSFVMLVLFQKGTSVSQDEGATFTEHLPKSESITRNPLTGAEESVVPDSILTVVPDPNRGGVFYAGAKNGLFRSEDSGTTWKPLDIIETSKKFPIRAIAVNPKNSQEIVYASGQAFYKSIDGGVKWATTDLPIARGVSHLLYNPDNPAEIYFTLRKF